MAAAGQPVADDDSRQSIFTAIKDQLGLETKVQEGGCDRGCDRADREANGELTVPTGIEDRLWQSTPSSVVAWALTPPCGRTCLARARQISWVRPVRPAARCCIGKHITDWAGSIFQNAGFGRSAAFRFETPGPLAHIDCFLRAVINRHGPGDPFFPGRPGILPADGVSAKRPPGRACPATGSPHSA